jgi:2-oxoglutarate ferredoxin oxidoreductase subunit gamma
MRGGTANCTVIISDEEIGAPTVARPDVAVVFSIPSFEKYEPLVKPGGLLIVNSSIVKETSQRTDIEVVALPANAIADELGSAKMMNMVMIGALLAKRPFLALEDICQTLQTHLPARKHHLLEANKQVLQRGYELATAVSPNLEPAIPA